jgi:hypothetical protein
VTTHRYDDAGRLVESITTTETEWDEVERAWAMTLTDVESDTCHGCGQPLSETLTRDAYEGYEAELPSVCQGCKALHRQQRNYVDDKDLHALRFTVRRTWRDEHGHQ